ncbi:glycosyltransferase [Halospina sp. K52047b]|uniref:glycosyltransferase n=1 Tax=Halospina sp. K52047b TaxID=2614160 RepID=UPI001787BB9E|nr:glycosyltransferase [Halospina sp. K52047b]
MDNPSRFASRGPFLKVDPGVDETVFYPGTSNMNLERSLRCGEAETAHVVFAGRLDPVKRVEHIIRAVGSVVNQGWSVYLSIVGDGSVRPELEHLAGTNLPGRVTFHGRQEPSALADILRASDVFMLTSRTENHPICIKEALACGLDVIAYGVGRVPQLLAGQNNSTVVPVGDEAALAEALRQRVDKGRIPPEQRVASNAVTWRDVAEKIVSWSEKEFKHRGPR